MWQILYVGRYKVKNILKDYLLIFCKQVGNCVSLMSSFELVLNFKFFAILYEISRNTRLKFVNTGKNWIDKAANSKKSRNENYTFWVDLCDLKREVSKFFYACFADEIQF